MDKEELIKFWKSSIQIRTVDLDQIYLGGGLRSVLALVLIDVGHVRPFLLCGADDVVLQLLVGRMRDRSFAVVSPQTWNMLPTSLHLVAIKRTLSFR